MGTRNTRLSPERLLEHRTWIQGLARSLCGDEATASDVVQEAYVAALRNPPRDHAQPPVLRAWLSRVVRRLSLQHQRAEARRSYRQRVAARPDELPDSSELVQRAELQSRLARAVVGLDEPYRETVLLRYFEDLSAAEIARRQGIPAATVRSRLMRGLERLREDLDQEYGERSAWSVCLATFVPRAAAPPLPVDGSSVSILEGVLAMKAVQVAVVGSVLLVAGIGIWKFTDGTGTLGARGPLAPEEGASAASLRDTADDEPEPLGVERAEEPGAREVVARAATPDVLETVPEPAPGTGSATVTARLVDEDDQGLLGASITLGQSELRAHSRAGGEVSLTFEFEGPEATFEFVARADGRAATWTRAAVRSGETTHLGVVRLVHAGGIAGVVRDADGNPLVGVRVVTTLLENEKRDPEEVRRRGPELDPHAPEVVSGIDGRFALQGVAEGSARVWGHAEGFAWSVAGPVKVRRTEVAQCELVLEPLRTDDRVTGIVQAPDGTPLEGVRIGYSFQTSSYASGGAELSEADGRFSILVQHRVPHDLEVRDPESRYVSLRRTVEPGSDPVVLRFAEAKPFEVRVTDEDGEPLEAFSVSTVMANDRYEWFSQAVAGDRPDGVATLNRPDEPFRILVQARGFAELLGEVIREPVQRVELALEPLAGVRGTVVADGKPVVGARVTLHDVISDHFEHRINGFRALTGDAKDETTSGTLGTFELFPEQRRAYTVRAQAGGFALAEIGPFDLDPSVALTDLELHLTRGGAIAGVVLTRAGVDPSGLVLGFNRGDGHARTLRVSPDGTYRIEGLTPGPWSVTRRDRELLPSEHSASFDGLGEVVPLEFDCEVVDGETTTYDLDLRDVPPCRVRGRLLGGGASFEGWTASLATPGIAVDDTVLHTGFVEEDGTFELQVDLSREVVLLVQAPMTPSGRLELTEVMQLEPGDREWTFDARFGSAGVRGALPSAGSEVVYEYRFEGVVEERELRVKQRCVVDGEGRIRLAVVPAGPGVIRRYTPGSNATERGAWHELVRFDAREGETIDVQLP